MSLNADRIEQLWREAWMAKGESPVTLLGANSIIARYLSDPPAAFDTDEEVVAAALALSVRYGSSYQAMQHNRIVAGDTDNPGQSLRALIQKARTAEQGGQPAPESKLAARVAALEIQNAALVSQRDALGVEVNRLRDRVAELERAAQPTGEVPEGPQGPGGDSSAEGGGSTDRMA